MLAGLFAVAPGWAAGPQIAGRRVALVIGNGQYRNVDRLPNSTNDARLIADTLRSLGFTLVGGGPLVDLDRARMGQAVQDFGKALAGAEAGLFYYSGHGLQVQGVNWLVPVDANPTRPQDLDFQMIDADLVLRQMDGAGTKLNLVLLDACRNNPFANRGLRSLQSGLAEMRAPEGTLISYATQPGNVAADGVGVNSPYTTALAASMRQPGIDIFRTFNQVGLQVKRSTGGAQQPWVSSSPIDGDFFFTPPAPPTVVAGLLRPPEPAPAPQPAPPDPANRLMAIVQEQRCSSLEARAVGAHTEISGLAASGPDWDQFIRQTAVTRGVHVVGAAGPGGKTGAGSGVELLPAFACAPIEALGASVRQTRASGGRLMAPMQRAVSAGDSLVVTIRGGASQAVRLDLFQADGMVLHLPVRPVDARAEELRLSIPQPAGSAPGPRLLTLVASPAPLDLGARPGAEPAGPYLAALQQAMAAAGPVRADMAPYEVRAAAALPVRIAAPPSGLATGLGPGPPSRPPRPSRCAGILERAQLGESISDADRAALRAECR